MASRNVQFVKKSFNKLKVYYSTITRVNGEFVEEEQEPQLFGILSQKKTIMATLTKLHKDKTILITGQQKIVEEYTLPIEEFLKQATLNIIEEPKQKL